MSIDRIELCGTVLNKRPKVSIEKERRYRFEKIYYIVDSQIVHAMIQKSSYGFNTFSSTRLIGEIQEGINPEKWYWVESKYNVADCLTRGRKPDDIGLGSTWQKSPDFLKQAEDKWLIIRDYLEPKLSERIRTTMVTKIEGPHDTLASRIDIAKYSSYGKLLRVTARIFWKFTANFPHLKNWHLKTLKRQRFSGSKRRLSRTWEMILRMASKTVCVLPHAKTASM